MLTHPRGPFRDTKFRPLGVLAPQIFTRSRHSPTFASAHPKRGSPNFLCRKLKIWLIIQHVRAYNFGISGSNLTKRYQAPWREAGVILWVQLLEWVPSTKFGRAKNASNIRRDFWQLSTVSANNSWIDRHDENLKSMWSTTTPPTLGAKTLVNFGPQTKSYRRAWWPTQLDFFRDTTVSHPLPLRFSDNFFQTDGNFLINFYTLIIRSFLH